MSANQTDPATVHAAAGKLIEFVTANFAESPEVQVAALRSAAEIIQLANDAQFAATLRAGAHRKFNK